MRRIGAVVGGTRPDSRGRMVAEWHNRAAGTAGYGLHGGTRAADHVRLILAEPRIATVRTQVVLSPFNDPALPSPSEPDVFTPGAHQAKPFAELLDDVAIRSQALRPVREGALT